MIKYKEGVKTMKRGMDKKKFETEIIKAIYLVADNETQEKIINRLVGRGFTKAVASDVMEGNALLGTFDTVELGIMADIIHRVGGISSIAVDRFLEEAEINAVNPHKIKHRVVKIDCPIKLPTDL